MPAAALQIEDTPNPHALKFITDQPWPAPTGHPADKAPPMRSYRTPEEAETAGDALAAAVFAAGPIVSVMVVGHFVTVNKKPSARWAKLKPKIEAVLRHHLDV
ncbi:MAG: NifU N-terminal domain-containing protein [Planctomycetota bacterium]